jgi:UDP-galactose-lipid carrier transferase
LLHNDSHVIEPGAVVVRPPPETGSVAAVARQFEPHATHGVVDITDRNALPPRAVPAVLHLPPTRRGAYNRTLVTDLLDRRKASPTVAPRALQAPLIREPSIVTLPVFGDPPLVLISRDAGFISNQQIVSGPLARSAKRGFDAIFAALLLLGASPLMLALAWLVRRDGKLALYRHKRIGAGGRSFYCIKFRSMVPDADGILADLLARDPNAAAEWQATQKLRRDPRVTPIGRFLRKTSLDELPQLLNVLRGEMSLVGPRPIVTSETRFYGEYIDDYYAIRPGVTGLWQVSGRSDTTYERRVQLDVWYVRNWTLWRDIVILLKTLPIVMLRRGAV